jgi:hypothetical protein
MSGAHQVSAWQSVDQSEIFFFYPVWIERNQPFHVGLLCFGKGRAGTFRRGLRVAGVTAGLPGQRYSLQLQQLPNCISQYQAGMSLGPRRVRRGSTPSPLGKRPGVTLLAH